jgi:hypothetical protein
MASALTDWAYRKHRKRGEQIYGERTVSRTGGGHRQVRASPWRQIPSSALSPTRRRGTRARAPAQREGRCWRQSVIPFAGWQRQQTGLPIGRFRNLPRARAKPQSNRATPKDRPFCWRCLPDRALPRRVLPVLAMPLLPYRALSPEGDSHTAHASDGFQR